MLNLIRPALSLLISFTVITGVVYPFAVTAVTQLAMPDQANGSLIVRDGKPIGSALIGQSFNAPENFWGRPSATSAKPYDAAASSGSNLAPSNPALAEAINARVKTLRADGRTAPIPVDLVTASASGLDPHISLAAAKYQVARVAAARKRSVVQISELVDSQTERPLFGFIGEARVNVLKLNLALQNLQ
jgi:potassium-transporting ATPase KdpC subunit